MQDVQARQLMPDAPWLASYSSGIDWSADFPAMPLWDLFDQAVGRFAHRPCLDFLGRVWTYEQIGRLVDRAAACRRWASAPAPRSACSCRIPPTS
jgi:hypothetical protein